MEAEISGAIRSVAAAGSLVQQAFDIAKKTRNAELCDIIADLRVELSQVKIATANANEQIVMLLNEKQALKKENETIKSENEKLKQPSEMEYRKNGYYDQEGKGPFCPRCWEGKQTRNRLSKIGPLLKCDPCGYSDY